MTALLLEFANVKGNDSNIKVTTIQNCQISSI
jgi:hypothetical protein